MQRRLSAGERIRHTGSQRDKRDGGDEVVEANEAAEDGGHVANDGREQADHHQGETEGQPAATVRGRRDECEQYLENGKSTL